MEMRKICARRAEMGQQLFVMPMILFPQMQGLKSRNESLGNGLLRARRGESENKVQMFSIRMQEDDRDGRGTGRGTAVITRTKPKVKKPNLYRVLLLNDDYTPMEFVILVLERFFFFFRESATRIMLHVHHHCVGECGVYTFELAETKVSQVMDSGRQNQHPLQCVMEKK